MSREELIYERNLKLKKAYEKYYEKLNTLDEELQEELKSIRLSYINSLGD